MKINKQLVIILIISILFFTNTVYATEYGTKGTRDIDIIQESWYTYYDLTQYLENLTKHGMPSKITKIDDGVYITKVGDIALNIYKNKLSRNKLNKSFRDGFTIPVDIIERDGKPYLSFGDMKQLYGFNDNIKYKNTFLNFKKHGVVYEEVMNDIYTQMYSDFGKEEIDFSEVGSNYFFNVRLNTKNGEYSRDLYMDLKQYILPLELRTKYYAVDKIIKVEDFNFEGVLANHDWHVNQKLTGEFSKKNCFPASIVQAFNLVTLDHKVDTTYVRKKLKRETGTGTALRDINNGALQIPFKEVKNYTLDSINRLIEDDNIVIIGVNTDDYYNNKGKLKKNNGHAITINGYIDAQGTRYYKIQNTGKASGGNNYRTEEEMKSYIVDTYGTPIYSNKERLEEYLVKYSLLNEEVVEKE